MPKKILVVDDSGSLRQVERFVLSNAGYEVIEAGDGKEALKALEAGPVHLILTDLNMPNLDGVGLIRAVRADAKHRLTPIVMITTESKDAKKQEGRQAGATGWVVKPFTPDQLLSVVRRVLG